MKPLSESLENPFKRFSIRKRTKSQAAVEEVEEILGLKSHEKILFIKAAELEKNGKNPYDLVYAAKQAREKGLIGERGILYL